MSITNRKEPLILVLGDIFFFLVSLYLMLIVRYHMFPTEELFYAHLVPFAILFAVWLMVFFAAGLYEKHTLILKNRLPNIILNAQIINSVIAVLFFYFIPYFEITPKTNLFLYLVFSFALVLWWRVYGSEVLGVRKPSRAILIGSGAEMQELKAEVNNNNRYYLKFVSSIDLDEVKGLDLQEDIINHVYSEGITDIVVNLRHEQVDTLLPHLYNLIFSHVRFVDMHKVYEDIFDRVPLSLVKYSWFLENISATRKFTFDLVKRFMDIIIALPAALISLVAYPFVWIAVLLDDRGPLFFAQKRIGANNRTTTIYKFRSMGVDANGEHIVTKVGSFLRKSRLDELPQLWNVIRGDLSLIGPRPEMPELGKQYEQEVPYYNVRHLIKPGLSGWAQIHHDAHPHHGADSKETAVKLSYDLYYLKNRSVMLDLKIALRTLRTLLSRSGR